MFTFHSLWFRQAASARPSVALRLGGLARASAIAAFGSFACAGPALAVDPNFVTVVTAIPSTVTHSSSFATYAQYEVKITNYKPNPIVGVRLNGTTSVAGAVAAAPFWTSNGVACATDTPATSIVCPIGEVAGGGATKTFTVTFSAPAAGTQINFAWSNFFDESGSGGSDGNTGTASTALSAPSTTQVSSLVLPAGGTFFTGATGVASPADPSTTRVVVPAIPGGTTAEVLEAIDSASCSAQLLACFMSTLTIPGSFADLLVFELNRDATTFRKGVKAENFVIRYTPTGGSEITLESCALGGPSQHVPCIESREIFTKKTAPTTEHVGDFRAVIFAVDNGVMRF